VVKSSANRRLPPVASSMIAVVPFVAADFSPAGSATKTGHRAGGHREPPSSIRTRPQSMADTPNRPRMSANSCGTIVARDVYSR
jgi:hypothetical protein